MRQQIHKNKSFFSFFSTMIVNREKNHYNFRVHMYVFWLFIIFTHWKECCCKKKRWWL